MSNTYRDRRKNKYKRQLVEWLKHKTLYELSAQPYKLRKDYDSFMNMKGWTNTDLEKVRPHYDKSPGWFNRMHDKSRRITRDMLQKVDFEHADDQELLFPLSRKPKVYFW